MTVTIDKFGRMTIPEKIRRAIGLVVGQEINLVITQRGFEVTPKLKVNYASLVSTRN